MDDRQVWQAHAEINRRIQNGSALRKGSDQRGGPYTSFFVSLDDAARALKAAGIELRHDISFTYRGVGGMIQRYGYGCDLVIRDADEVAAMFYLEIVRDLPVPGAGLDVKPLASDSDGGVVE